MCYRHEKRRKKQESLYIIFETTLLASQSDIIEIIGLRGQTSARSGRFVC